MKKYIWMAVDTDEYELPIAVADSAKELGDIFGVKKHSVIGSITRGYSGRENGYKYVRVVDDGQNV